MKKRRPFITIDDPCSENWDKMDQGPQGKFCDSCQKTVFDFSELSDVQLIRLLEKSQGSICGRFREDQLNRILIDPRNQDHPSLLKWVAGLLLVTSSGVAYTQEQTEVPTEQTIEISTNEEQIPNQTRPLPKTPPKIRLVEGSILNKSTLSPIAQVKISLSGSGLFVYSDENGFFSIPIPDEFVNERIELTFSQKGHRSHEFSVDYSKLPVAINIYLSKKTKKSLRRHRYKMGVVNHGFRSKF